MTRECPEMRILSDELANAVKAKLNLGSMRFGTNAAELRRDGKDPGRRADVYPTVLVHPVCGGCGKPMALSRSTSKYKSFVCLNSIHGGHGCRNKGNKSARIIDEAVHKEEQRRNRRPPDGTDSCASRRPRHSTGGRAAVGDLRSEAVALLSR